jgi:peptidoglycan/xylan/chitin deacetylase (PgdA/CDA1 family)
LKQGLLQFILKSLVSVGFLRALLSFVERWELKTEANRRLTFPYVKRQRSPKFEILRYHRVNDENDPIFGAVPVKMFQKQMEVLANYFNVLPLEELVERALHRDIPPAAVAITFDDGYRDNYENSFPILKRLGLPATIFLATGPLESGAPLWHDLVFEAFRMTNAEVVSVDGKNYPLKTAAQKGTALFAFREYLRMYDYRNWGKLIEQMIGRLGVPQDSMANRAQKLSWDEIEEMSKNDITFGAHTVTHPILTRMSLAEAAEEIKASKEAIEEKLKSPVRVFAYPNGRQDDFNESIKEVLKEAGFLCAATILWGTNSIDTDPFELRRVGVWDTDTNSYALRLGWYKFIS